MPATVPLAPEAVDFLEHLHAHTEGGWLSLFAINRDTGKRPVLWGRTAAELAPAIEQHTPQCCVWYGVATRKQRLPDGRRGGALDCLQVPALWVDIDVLGPNHATDDLPPDMAAAQALIDEFPLPPTVTVVTGGGLQPLWLLDEPLDADQARPLLERWGATWTELSSRHGWHLDNVFDVARILRLPGTYNRKNEPTPVTLSHADWDRTYSADDLDQYTIEPPEPPPTERKRTTPYIGPERPGDAYNLNPHPTPEQLLAEIGFHHAKRQPNGDVAMWAEHRGHTETSGATIYGDDGHITIYSATAASKAGLVEKRPYDPFGLYVAIRHDGDWSAATRALREDGYGSDIGDWGELKGLIADTVAEAVAAGNPEPDSELRAMLLDWPEFWARDHADAEWLVEPILAAKRSHAIFAPGGTGKSLLALWMAAGLASGRPMFDNPGGETIDVLYLDYEMTADDLAERLEAMGYGPDANLRHLHYALLPALPGLDEPEGGRAVVRLAQMVDAKLVIIDTFGRAVHGDENDADTVRAWYRWTGLHLKAAGRAFLRVDHAGKDLEKGQRGTSAKNDDVDVVWRLTQQDVGTFKLVAKKKRMSWVPESVELGRIDDDTLRYSLLSGTLPPGTQTVIDDLERLGVEPMESARRAATMLRAAGRGARNDVVRAAQKARKSAAMGVGNLLETASQSAPQTSGRGHFEPDDDVDSGSPGAHTETPGQTPGRGAGRGGARQADANGARCAPPVGGAPPQRDPETTPQTETEKLW